MREESSREGGCCNGLFDAFLFTRFQDAEPPRRKGIYVIRIHQRGTPVEEVHDKAITLAESIGWDVQADFYSRLNGLQRSATARRFTGRDAPGAEYPYGRCWNYTRHTYPIGRLPPGGSSTGDGRRAPGTAEALREE